MDPRSQQKKPLGHGSYKQQCGDNIYYLEEDKGRWEQHEHALFHKEPERIRQDLRHPYVFIADTYYYFGKNAQRIPPEFKSLILNRQRVKCEQNPEIVNGFLDWLATNFKPGIHGQPHLLENNCIDCNESDAPRYI